jgi:hypothetical protein
LPLLLLLLLQTVSESNREQLQPLIDLALQCAYNSSIQGEARCRPTTMSIAIAAVATVQQYNMTDDFVRLTQSVRASGSIPATHSSSSNAAAFEIAPDLDATTAALNANGSADTATTAAAADEPAAAVDANTNATDSTVSTAAVAAPARPAAAKAAAGNRNSHPNAQRDGQQQQQQQQTRRARPPAAGSSSSSRVSAAASTCASCAPCDYKSYAPGDYPNSCPGYFVSDSFISFVFFVH